MGQIVRKPFKTYHHGDLREALIQAALREVELGGPEAISIKALAKAARRLATGAVPAFADREALLEAVTAEAFRQFNVIMREAIEAAGQGLETVALCPRPRSPSGSSATASTG